MSDTRVGLRPGPSPRSVRDADSAVHDVPPGWELLPPGDAAVTRAVKAMGPTWAVEEKRGRKVFSRGIWAPGANIRDARAATEEQRNDPAYQRKLEAGRRRRAEEQADYVREFEAEVLRFLRFHPRHEAAARDLAARVTAHATPVGSGTVARTERIPVERRAEAAVIAWMRHQTTAYDDMSVAPVKGARRELRRELAERSRAVLQRYRRGDPVDVACPLAAALREPAAAPMPAPPPRPTTAPAPPRAFVSAPSRRTFAPAAPTTAAPGAPPSPRAAAPAASRPAAPPRAPGSSAAPPAPPRIPSIPPRRSAAPAVGPRSSPAPPAPPAPPTPPTPSVRAGVPSSRPAPRPAARPAAPTPPVAPHEPATAPAPTAPTHPTEPRPLPTPRTAHEEAQLALYLKVRARLTRGR